MMMMGPGIVGNRVIGSSDERHRGHSINAQTLAQQADGVRLTPGSIHRSLRNYLGIGEHPVLAPFRIGEPDLPLLS